MPFVRIQIGFLLIQYTVFRFHISVYDIVSNTHRNPIGIVCTNASMAWKPNLYSRFV